MNTQAPSDIYVLLCLFFIVCLFSYLFSCGGGEWSGGSLNAEINIKASFV